MANSKILCIDDTPDEIIDIFSQKSLRKILEGTFKGCPYGIVFATSGEEGIDIIRKNPDVRLVLLDIEFSGQPKQGAQIADDLYRIRQKLGIVVLTRFDERGKKTKFGWKPNILAYLVKKELSDIVWQERLRRLSEAIIEDPENKKWMLELDTDIGKLSLKRGREVFSMTFRSQKKIALLAACAQKPNECVSSVDMEGFIIDRNYPYDYYVNRPCYEINKQVRERTNWATWGILDPHCGGSSAVKLVIGEAKVDLPPSAADKGYFRWAYVTHSELNNYVSKIEFKRFQKEVKDRLSKIEELLGQKSKNK